MQVKEVKEDNEELKEKCEVLQEEYDKIKSMQNAESDNQRIFGLGDEVVRDTILPQTRDTLANGLNTSP